MRLPGLNLGLGAHHHAAAPGQVGLAHAAHAVDVSARGEVRSLDVLHQFLDGDVIVVDVGHAGVYHLGEVVRGHVGGHAHGDAAGAVHQQVRYARGHHGGLLQGVVEVVRHVDGLLVDVLHHVLAYLAQAALGVSHGCGAVAVHRAVVALPVDEHVAHGPGLRQAHQGAVDGRVAVRVVLTQHLAHHSGRFLIRFVRRVPQPHHAVEDAAVHGFETVAHIGKGTRDDDRHGVVDVGRLHFLLDVYFYNSVLFKHLRLWLINKCMVCRKTTLRYGFFPTYENFARKNLCLDGDSPPPLLSG